MKQVVKVTSSFSMVEVSLETPGNGSNGMTDLWDV